MYIPRPPPPPQILLVCVVFSSLPLLVVLKTLSGYQFLLHGDLHRPCCLHARFHLQQVEQEGDRLHSQGCGAGLRAWLTG